MRVTVSPETVLFKKKHSRADLGRPGDGRGRGHGRSEHGLRLLGSFLAHRHRGRPGVVLGWSRGERRRHQHHVRGRLHARQGAFLLGDVWRKDREQEDNGQDGFRRRTRRGFGARYWLQGQRDAGRARRARDLTPSSVSCTALSQAGNGAATAASGVVTKCAHRRKTFITVAALYTCGNAVTVVNGDIAVESTFTGMTFFVDTPDHTGCR